MFFRHVEYYLVKPQYISNVLSVIVICLLLAVIVFKIKKIDMTFISVRYKCMVMALSCITVFIQLIISFFAYFETGWDASTVFVAEMNLSIGVNDGVNLLYLSWHPNNLFITDFYALLFELWKSIVVIILLNIVINASTGLLTYIVIGKILNEKYAFFGYALYFVLGVSPWYLIYYTDAIALIFSVLLLFLYTLKTKNIVQYIWKWFVIGAVTAIGYAIKPTVFIIVIAIIIYEIISKHNLWVVVAIFAMLLSFKMVQFGLNKWYEYNGLIIEESMKIGWKHYFMMGLNDRTDGVFAAEDMGFSAGIEDKSIREKANVEEAFVRIKNYGFFGVLKHLRNKTMVIFNDGTFGWGIEGNFYAAKNVKFSPIARFIQSIVYSDEKGHVVLAIYAQIVWLFVLITNLISGISINKLNHKNDAMIITYISIIGVIMYQFLLEARSRYLYVFLPLMIIISANGISEVSTISVVSKEKK